MFVVLVYCYLVFGYLCLVIVGLLVMFFGLVIVGCGWWWCYFGDGCGLWWLYGFDYVCGY